MCWKSNKQPIRNIAEKEIKVIKVFSRIDKDVLYSPIWNFPYVFNTAMKNITVIPNSHFIGEKDGTHIIIYMINEGYHSYSLSTQFSKYERVIIIHKGLSWDCYFDNICTECTIPAGTIYYENEHGEIVSETIIINRIINFNYCDDLITFQNALNNL